MFPSMTRNLAASRAGDSDNIEKIVMMNEFASIRTRGSSDPGRAGTGNRPGALQVLIVSLLVALVAAGCSGGEGNVVGESVGQIDNGGSESVGKDANGGGEGVAKVADGGGEDTDGSGESVVQNDIGGDEGPGEDANVVVMFPQHDAPLGTDNGGNYHAGRLVLNEGCLRIEVPPDANGPGRASLLIWPSGFALNVERGVVRIVDSDGEIAASVGDHIRLSRATVSYQEATDQGLLRGMSEDCAGLFYLVGDEVTVFDPNNEPAELQLSDPDLIFARRKTVIATSRAYPIAAGIGELVLDGPCLRLGGGDGHGDTIIWPAGFTPHVDQGVVQVRNGAGRVIAQVGDRIAGGGGYSSSGYGDCPGGTFGIHSIKVLPDVEVYFPKQDGSLGTDQGMERFVGKLVVERSCLMVDAPVRVSDRVIMPGGRYLLIWPDTFTLSLDEEVAGVVDAFGRVAARVGDEIQFSAVAVTYGEAMEHSGLKEITPACSGGYWVVGEDFAAVPDSESP